MSATEGYWELPSGYGNFEDHPTRHERYWTTGYPDQRFPTLKAANEFIERVGFVDYNFQPVKPKFVKWDF